MPQILSALNVLFFPSKFEGLGGVVLEAQAAGVPVVESNVIPEETDLGLQLIEKVSLDAPLLDWDNAVMRSLEKLVPPKEVVFGAFKERGFSLESVTEKYLDTYKGNTK
jgi:glycosyltransferase EpsF